MASAQDRQHRSSSSPSNAKGGDADRERTDWRIWRPQQRPRLLYVAVVVFIAWIGFLVAMIRA